jgi:NADPH:quinone reductase-like Zn-dependent oxidoreductase/acyl carrier protein
MQTLPGGGVMYAVAAPENEVAAELAAHGGAVSIAAVNAPASVVISGPAAPTGQVAELFTARGRRVRQLRVSHAFHSALMDPVLEELGQAAARLVHHEPELVWASGLSGQLASGCEPGYWTRQAREPVRYGAAVTALAAAGVQTFIEIGPDATLTALGAHAIPAAQDGDSDGREAVFIPLQRSALPSGQALLAALGAAHVRGIAVDWAGVLGGGTVIDLPTYAFQRQRFWPQPGGAGDVTAAGLDAVGHPLLGAAVQVAGGDQLVLTGRISVRSQPWLADHVVGGQVLVPGTALLELAVRAGDAAGCGQVTELTMQTPMVLPAEGTVQVQVVVGAPDGQGRRPVEVFGHPAGPGQIVDGPWTCHAQGLLAPADPAAELAANTGELAVWPPPGAAPVDTSGWYEQLAGDGFGYGPAFCGLAGAWQRGDEVFAEAVLPEAAGEAARFRLHPALLDSVLHAAGLTGISGDGMQVPFAWTGVVLHAAGASMLHARLRLAQDGTITLTAADGTGRPVITVRGLALRPVTAAQLQAARDGAGQGLFSVNWVPIPAGVPAGTWAVAGPDPYKAAAGLAAAGARVTSFADLAAMAAAIQDGAPVPDLLAVTADGDLMAGGGDLDAGHRAAVVGGRVLGVVQEWLAGPAAGARLVVMTQDAVAARPGDRLSGLAGAAAWGLARSAQAENPDRIILADLPPAGEAGEVFGPLAAAAGSGEPEVAVRDGQVWGRRLGRPASGLRAPAEDQAWRLEASSGTIDGLALVPHFLPEELAAGQVLVAVRAAGLNFRDVLISVGMYPGGGVIGSEIAGVVTAAGPGVRHLKPGDRVMGLAEGAFGPAAVTDARLLTPIPAGWSFAQAAAIPIAFLTAWYGLVDLGCARAGQKLLVHSAAGGVGMAAVAIARHLGLDVYGTASPGKHPVLAALGLDEDHIGSSRDDGFAARFTAVTGGTGMDIVLNALAGELTDASLGLLPRGGAFVEMGKTDPRDPARIAADYPRVAYQAFDLGQAGPDRLGEILAEVTKLLTTGDLAMAPVTGWDVRQAPDAFRYMSQARHTGKIVLTIPPAPAGAGVRKAGTVLITGGTGTLGGLTARHLASTGRVTQCVLASRSGPAASGVPALTAALATAGTPVRVLAADLAVPAQATALVTAAADEGRLAMVIHAAGIIDDATITTMTPGQVGTVMAAKAAAAWQLHQATRDADLDGFVLFSSAASVLGGAGQGNYAAANAFLDALAAYRHAAGLPAQSLAWGLWEQDSAITAGLGEAGRARISRSGMTALTDTDGLALLDAAPGCPQPLLMAARLDLPRIRNQAGTLPPLWRVLAGTGPRPDAGGAASDGGSGLQRQLAVLAPAEQDRMLTGLVREHAAAVLGHLSSAAVEPGRAFTDLGFDSLTAVELRNRLTAASGLPLPATLTFDYPTPKAVAQHLRTQLNPQITAGTTEAMAEITRLETILSAIPADSADGAGVMAKLQDFLSRWASSAEQVPAAADGDIESATPDEIFQIIEHEFRKP